MSKNNKDKFENSHLLEG